MKWFSEGSSKTCHVFVQFGLTDVALMHNSDQDVNGIRHPALQKFSIVPAMEYYFMRGQRQQSKSNPVPVPPTGTLAAHYSPVAERSNNSETALTGRMQSGKVLEIPKNTRLPCYAIGATMSSARQSR